jgi:pentapeptide MXKDX repeat protein
MTKRIALILSAATVSLGLALTPAAFAQEAKKDDHMMKKDDGMKKDAMKKDDGMKKDAMKKDDGMKKDDHMKK